MNDIEGRWPNRTWFVQGFVNNLLNLKDTPVYLGVVTMVTTPETPAATMFYSSSS
jgi:threonine/homoserine/homoserine lactone efflux protein